MVCKGGGNRTQVFQLVELQCYHRAKSAHHQQMVEFNHLFQNDQGKTASAARILSPNPMRQPLPCLLIQSLFYGLSLLISLCAAGSTKWKTLLFFFISRPDTNRFLCGMLLRQTSVSETLTKVRKNVAFSNPQISRDFKVIF